MCNLLTLLNVCKVQLDAFTPCAPPPAHAVTCSACLRLQLQLCLGLLFMMSMMCMRRRLQPGHYYWAAGLLVLVSSFEHTNVMLGAVIDDPGMPCTSDLAAKASSVRG